MVPDEGLPASRRGRGRRVEVVRVYEDPGRSGRDRRVLVDRLWPRGVTKASIDLDEWAREVAPSTELRRWYGHAPERFEEFAGRYRAELAEQPAAAVVARLASEATRARLVLLTATRDLERSAAMVLKAVLEGTGRPSPAADNPQRGGPASSDRMGRAVWE